MSASNAKDKSSSDYETGVSSSSPASAIGSISRRNRAEVNRDGGWGWMVVLGSCVCQFFLIGIHRSMGIIYILLQDRFGATEKETVLAASIFVSLRALGAPLASKLSERFGCRAVTVTGGVFLCLGLVASAFAVNLINMYLTFGIVAGFGSVLVFSPSYIAVSEWFDEKRGKAMSFATLGTGLGSIVMALTVSALVAYYGYFGTMLISGALMLHCSVGGALYRTPPDDGREFSSTVAVQSPDSREDGKNLCANNEGGESGKPSNKSDEHRNRQEVSETTPLLNNNSSNQDLGQNSESATNTGTSASASDPQPSRCCSGSSLCCNIPFIIYCLMATATQGCIQSVLIFLPGRGQELGQSRKHAALLLMIFGVSDMVGRFVFGFIFDIASLRSRRTHLYTGIAASFAVFAIALGFMPSFISLAAVTVLVAFFEGGAHSQRATNVTDLVKPSQVSLGVGLVIFSQGVGNFYGPLVGGVLKDHTRSFANCFFFGGASLMVVCMLAALHSAVLHRNNVRRKNIQNRQIEKI